MGVRALVALLVMLSMLLWHSWLILLIYVLSFLGLAACLGILAKLLHRLAPMLYIGAVMILLHSLVNPHNTHFILFFGVEGFSYGLHTALRLLCIVAIVQMFLLTNSLRAMITALNWVHSDLGTVFGLVLSMLPVMQTQLEITLKAQTARGMRLGRLPWQRLPAYLAVMIPIIIKSLLRAQVMAQLLHLRGYGIKRMSREVRWGAADSIVLTGGLVFFAGNAWLSMTYFA